MKGPPKPPQSAVKRGMASLYRRREVPGGCYDALLREGRITLGRAVGAYIGELQARDYSPATVRGVSGVIKAFYRTSALRPASPLSAVTRSVAERVMRAFHARHAPATTWHRAATLTLLFRTFAAAGLLLENPFAALVPLRKPKPLPLPTLTREEVGRLLGAACRPRDRAILEVFYSTAIRLKECAKLDLGDVDLARGTLHVRQGKGGKDRVVPLGMDAVKHLTRYLAVDRRGGAKALWIGFCGRRLGDQRISLMIRQAARRAGIGKPASPHTLRRTCATHLLDGGASPWVVKEILGHSDFTSLGRYVSIDVRSLKEMHEKTHPRA